MADTPERELIEHDHVAEACERLRDRDWPSFTPDQIVHVRIGDIRALLSRVDKMEERVRELREALNDIRWDASFQNTGAKSFEFVMETAVDALNRSAS